MRSIIQTENECFLCGKTAPLQLHHCIEGANRAAADKYGLTVLLCPDCHLYGARAVHRSSEVMRDMKKMAQKKAMGFYNWTVADWLEHFTKSYI